jgi:hypothetical protein
MSPVNSPHSNVISIDELDHAILSCAARMNAATYDMLLLIRQFDERGGFRQKQPSIAGTFFDAEKI